MRPPEVNLADAAEALLGSPFRLGGRDPETGLDCVGLVAAALERIGLPVGVMPAYGLRQYELHRFINLADHVGLHPSACPETRGDVLLMRPSPSQIHLGISLGSHGIIHAHAELRRVVITPLPVPWPVTHRWRLTRTGETPWPHSSSAPLAESSVARSGVDSGHCSGTRSII